MTTHREAAALVPSAESSDWIEAHEALSRLARERAVLDAEEGRWLLGALRAEVHVHLACGSFCQYIEQLFGYKPRTTQEKLRVAEALEGLPRLAAALASGSLGWCAARELTRVAVPETEDAWLEAARGKTQRQLEQLVADKTPGQTPDAPATDATRRHVLRFEVAPDTFATFRQAMQHLQRAAGSRLDHDALLLTMARHALGGPPEHGRSTYQISLHVCSACKRGEQVAAGELVPVDAPIVEMAECDAQHLGDVLAPAIAQRAANENASPRDSSSRKPTAAAPESDDGMPAQAGPTPNVANAAPAESNTHEPNADTANRCWSHAHVGSRLHNASGNATDRLPADAVPPIPATTSSSPEHPIPRARQNIPPALRRAVLDRDRHRCQVPGCTHTTYVDVHHIQRRVDGGSNVIDNLLTLCSAHHRATHHGQLLIERAPDQRIAFRHADGRNYGDPTTPQRIDAYTKVFSALRHLGFRESDVKAVLAELRADPTLADAPKERLLREALCRIQPRPR